MNPEECLTASSEGTLPDQFEIIMDILPAVILPSFVLQAKMRTLDYIIRIMTKKGYTVTERRNDTNLTVIWSFTKEKKK